VTESSEPVLFDGFNGRLRSPLSAVNDLMLVAVWPWLCAWIVMGLIRLMVGYKPRYRDAYLASLLPMAGLYILRALLEVSGVISKTALMSGSVYSYASLLLYILGFFLGLIFIGELRTF
jgi:hypothetical protein